jgi:hypothetical protein
MLEFQLTSSSTAAMHIWMAVPLSLSFFLTIVFLLLMVSARFELSPKHYRFSKLLLAVLAGLQIFAWQLYLYSQNHDKVALWCFPLALFGGVIVWRISNGSYGRHPWVARILPMAIFLISVAELAGFAQATRQFSNTIAMQGCSSDVSNVGTPGKLVEKAAFRATTDSGIPVRLFERQITTNAFRAYLERCRESFAAISERAMLRAKPFVQSNCHGWVFTQGQHILIGEDVELILKGNNYTEVSTPQANDVVVYRSNEGLILHTGVVRGSLEGATIVESKWGIGALYLHIAEEQPYSQNLTYFRTARPSHSITIAHSHEGPAAKADLFANQLIDDGIERGSFDTHFCSSQSK